MHAPATPHKLDKLIRELEEVLKERGTTRAEVQRHLGWGNSRISDLKAHPSPLKISDLLEILSVAGVEPSEFMERVYGRAEPSTDLLEIRMTIEALIEKLDVLSESNQPAPPAALWIARTVARLLRPLARVLRGGVSTLAIETALVEVAVVAFTSVRGPLDRGNHELRRCQDPLDDSVSPL